MAEYIERVAAVKVVLRERKPTNSVAQNRMLSIIQRDLLTMRAADVAPVVHGRWVSHYRSGTTVAEGCVSTCCDMWNNRKSDYCPNCGAKMDGGADDEVRHM